MGLMLSPSPKGFQSPKFSESDFREVRGLGRPKSSDNNISKVTRVQQTAVRPRVYEWSTAALAWLVACVVWQKQYPDGIHSQRDASRLIKFDYTILYYRWTSKARKHSKRQNVIHGLSGLGLGVLYRSIREMSYPKATIASVHRIWSSGCPTGKDWSKSYRLDIC
jgi:hypothetical protein